MLDNDDILNTVNDDDKSNQKDTPNNEKDKEQKQSTVSKPREFDKLHKDFEKEQSFLDHLEALRWHIIRALIVVVIFMILSYIFSELIWRYIILAPKNENFITFKAFCSLSDLLHIDMFCINKPLPFILQSRKVFGQFTMDLLVSFTMGIIVAFPYVIWEMWRFVKPGLYDKERTASKGAVFWVTVLFFLGISFGYYLVAPLSLHFLSNYQVLGDVVENQFDIVSYVSFLTTLTLTCGLMFQLPIVSLFLGKSGLIGSTYLKQYFKHAIVIILFISAVITPPDVISQLLIAAPLVLLYQVSILLVKREEKRYDKQFNSKNN